MKLFKALRFNLSFVMGLIHHENPHQYHALKA
jgi:hypothetical protein